MADNDGNSAKGLKGGSRNLTFSMLEQLGRAIVTGHYDNERFPTEDELTSRYAVSRTVTL